MHVLSLWARISLNIRELWASARARKKLPPLEASGAAKRTSHGTDSVMLVVCVCEWAVISMALRLPKGCRPGVWSLSRQIQSWISEYVENNAVFVCAPHLGQRSRYNALLFLYLIKFIARRPWEDARRSNAELHACVHILIPYMYMCLTSGWMHSARIDKREKASVPLAWDARTQFHPGKERRDIWTWA